MKTAATTLLVVCVVVFCVISVAWLEGIFSSTPNTAWRGDSLIRVPLHRPPVRIKLGSYASLVARILHAKHLTSSDRDDFAACQDKHKKFSNEWRLGACVFVDPASRSEGAVALVSLPGSGNTWLRGLLERATGVCTGKSGVFIIIRSTQPPASFLDSLVSLCTLRDLGALARGGGKFSMGEIPVYFRTLLHGILNSSFIARHIPPS